MSQIIVAVHARMEHQAAASSMLPDAARLPPPSSRARVYVELDEAEEEGIKLRAAEEVHETLAWTRWTIVGASGTIGFALTLMLMAVNTSDMHFGMVAIAGMVGAACSNAAYDVLTHHFVALDEAQDLPRLLLEGP